MAFVKCVLAKPFCRSW